MWFCAIFQEDVLVATTNTAHFFNEISNAPSSIKDVGELITVSIFGLYFKSSLFFSTAHIPIDVSFIFQIFSYVEH